MTKAGVMNRMVRTDVISVIRIKSGVAAEEIIRYVVKAERVVWELMIKISVQAFAV